VATNSSRREYGLDIELLMLVNQFCEGQDERGGSDGVANVTTHGRSSIISSILTIRFSGLYCSFNTTELTDDFKLWYSIAKSSTH
jgi:hypothetical protein